MNKLRKAFIVSVMFATVFSMSMVVVPEVKAASAGDLIKMDGLSSVYYLAADGKRYVFPNETTFFSWYSDFSSVVTIPQSELETYPLGANVTVRPGTKLVKITTNPKVYAVESGGVLKWVPDEETALTLFGANWAQRIVDVPDSFFTNYTISESQISASAYPVGSLVKWSAAADVYYIDASGNARKIADEAAFLANRFKWNDVIAAPDTVAMPAAGTDLAGADADIIDTSSGAGGTAGAGTGLTVALASDTPAAASVPSKATGVVFTKFNVTASNDGSVTIQNITVSHSGIGAITEFTKVYIYEGATRLTNGKTISSSNNAATFNSVNVSVPAGTTKALSLVGDIAAASTGNHALSISAAANITTNGAVVSGSFPVTGNKMSLSATAVATLTVTQNNGTTGITSKIGEDNIEIADFDLDNDSEEDVELTGVVLSNGGNAVAGNLGNINLYYMGSSIATGELANNKIAFTFDPITIEKSDSNVNFKVKADIEGGISNTVKLYVAQGADITAVGKTYGYNAGVTYGDFDSSSEAYPVTINGSEVNVNFATDNAKTVIADQKNFVFATLDVTVSQDISVTEMQVSVDETDIGSVVGAIDIDDLELRNTTTGEIIDGTVVSGSGDTASTSVVWKFENFTWETGSAAWQIRGDIPSNVDTGDTYRVLIDLSSDFTARFPSNDEVVAADLSTTALTGKTKTIGGASLTVSAGSYNTGDSVASDTGVALAGGKLTAGSVSDIAITEMTFHGNGGTATTTETGALDATDNNFFDKTNVGTIYLKVNGTTVSQKGAGSLTNGEVTFDNFSSEVKVVESSDSVFEVVLDVAGTLDTVYKMINIQLTGISATDKNNTSISATEVGEGTTAISATQRVDFGRVVWLRSSGKLTISMDNTVDGVDSNKYILAGTSGKKLARMKIKTEYENVLIKTIVVANNDTNADVSVNNMHITDASGNILTSQGAVAGAASSTVTFNNEDGLFTVNKGTAYYYITVDTRNTGQGATDTARSQDYFEVSAASFAAQGVGSGADLVQGTTITYGDSVGNRTIKSNKATLVAVRISAIEDDSAALTLATGEQTVFRVKVTTESGTNASSTGDTLKAEVRQVKTQINFRYASNLSTVATSTALKLYRDGKAGYVTTSVTATGDTVTFDLTNVINGTSWAANNYKIDAGTTATFYVKAQIAYADTNDYVQVKLPVLDGTSSTGSVKWTDQAGTNMYSLLLGKTELVGDTVN